MKITASLVKELRDRTSLGMMECKKALAENEGDINKAIDSLRKSSALKAAKKASRVAAEGLVKIHINSDKTSAVVVEINCETDFVAKDSNFTQFVDNVVKAAHEKQSTNIQDYPEIEKERELLVQKIGENITIRRIAMQHSKDGVISGYVHNNYKIASLVALDSNNEELARTIAMHIAAAKPLVISPQQVPEETIAKEKEIFQTQAEATGKPANIIERIVAGKIKSFLNEVSLTEQLNVRDGETKIGALLKQNNCNVASFVRYEVGEGIEKKEVDFREEVLQQAGL